MTESDDRPLQPVFHDGEVAMQESVGLAREIGERGRHFVRTFMPDQHRTFFGQLPFINLSALDGQGQPWAFLRAGAPGFVSSPDNTTLVIVSEPLPGEPDDLDLSPGAKVGVVGIELPTRRRNRMNATVLSSSAGELKLQVDQSFGNCPQYIHRRQVTAAGKRSGAPRIAIREELGPADIEIIRSADSLFIASRTPELEADARSGLDINHRGGLPGFVKVRADNTLVIPDYRGNNFFNTLGNILLDGRSGLQFLDFQSGRLLSLTGHATVTLNDADLEEEIGTARFTSFRADQIICAENALPFTFALGDRWPRTPLPGNS